MNAMCELFGMSASTPARADVLLRPFGLRGGLAADNPDGWGLASWDDDGFRIFKEPRPAAHSARFAELCGTVCSRLVVAHVRKARYPPINTLANTHPFVHTCCGKQWVFAHNGLVPGVVGLERGRPNPDCRPTGETDSEYAFCHLLACVAKTFERAHPGDPAAWMSALAAVSEVLTAYGKFNFLLSDGDYLIAYAHDRLHRAEQHGAGPSSSTPRDLVAVATEPIGNGRGWTAFEAGELRVYRLGVLAGSILTRPSPMPRIAQSGEPASTAASMSARPIDVRLPG
jgi:predicted glutamine amidotransferase